MTGRIDALRALEEVVDAGTLTDRGNEHWLAAMPRKTWEHIVKANSGSLDAAKALHEALLPNHSWDIWRGIGPDCVKYYGCNIPGIDTVYVADPARAWLLAIIRALIAQEGGE